MKKFRQFSFFLVTNIFLLTQTFSQESYPLRLIEAIDPSGSLVKVLSGSSSLNEKNINQEDLTYTVEENGLLTAFIPELSNNLKNQINSFSFEIFLRKKESEQFQLIGKSSLNLGNDYEQMILLHKFVQKDDKIKVIFNLNYHVKEDNKVKARVLLVIRRL